MTGHSETSGLIVRTVGGIIAPSESIRLNGESDLTVQTSAS